MGKRTWAAAAIVTLLIALSAATGAPAQSARTHHGGPLSGTWIGYISRQTSSGPTRRKIVIEVNARETRGTWQLGPASCHGTLTLQSISSGYHHFLRHVAAAARCAGGDVDCLMPDGTDIYDSVTSHLGGAYDEGGKLTPVRS